MGYKRNKNYFRILDGIYEREDFKKLDREQQKEAKLLVKLNLLASFPVGGNMLHLANKHIPKATEMAHAVIDHYLEAIQSDSEHGQLLSEGHQY